MVGSAERKTLFRIQTNKSKVKLFAQSFVRENTPYPKSQRKLCDCRCVVTATRRWVLFGFLRIDAKCRSAKICVVSTLNKRHENYTEIQT